MILKERCQLCGLKDQKLTKHHLIPKGRGHRGFIRVCKPCHRQIHILFNEKELAKNYSNLRDLKNNKMIRKWINWRRKRRNLQ